MHAQSHTARPTCLQIGELQICWPDDLPGGAITHDEPGLVRDAIITLDHTDGACHEVVMSQSVTRQIKLGLVLRAAQFGQACGSEGLLAYLYSCQW